MTGTTYLMLCDKPVYCITEARVLDAVLCPFMDAADPQKAYENWRSHRSYLKTNRLAEQVINLSGGKDTKSARRRMSLSDGYWVQYEYDRKSVTKFANITPYLNPFSQAEIYPGVGNSASTPELTLGGAQPKRWMRGTDGLTHMRKIVDTDQLPAEMFAIKLARTCRIPVANAFVELDGKRVYADEYITSPAGQTAINVLNITDVNLSLIPLDQLGIGVNGYDLANVADAFKKAGVAGECEQLLLTEIILDGIVGNSDREHNNSNWAVIMDNRTGQRTPSPMYDFNWAVLGAKNTRAIQRIAGYARVAHMETAAAKIAEHLAGKCMELGLETWRANADALIEELR